MIRQFLGFDCLGHAGYAEEGEDIVCAAISALVINTINSLEMFTRGNIFYSDSDEETGMITLSDLTDRQVHDADLLHEIPGFRLAKEYENTYAK